MSLRRRTVLVVGLGTVVTLAGAQELGESSSEPAPPLPAYPSVVRRHRIPHDAVWVSPTGKDTDPGTRARPRGTLQAGAVNALTGGRYFGFSQELPRGTTTTVIVPRRQTAVLDGEGRIGSALVCAGVVNLYGDLRITNYAPTSTDVGLNAPVYYGGTSAGSEIDGARITSSTMAGLGFQVPLHLTRLTIDGCGYSGILGTTADGTRFGDVEVYRVNRDNYGQDGQLAAIKVTRSADVRFSRGVRVQDTNGANGIWTDVSCRRPVVAGAKVLTSGAGPAAIGLLLEETEGGAVVGAEVEGVYAAEVVATGHVRLWGNTFTGTSVALTLRQDRDGNSGSNPANLSPADAPWWTVGNEIDANTLVATGGHGIAFTTMTTGDALGRLTTGDMLASLRGNTFTGTVELETSPGDRETFRARQLAALLGSRYSSEAPAVPADVAALGGGAT